MSYVDTYSMLYGRPWPLIIELFHTPLYSFLEQCLYVKSAFVFQVTFELILRCLLLIHDLYSKNMGLLNEHRYVAQKFVQNWITHAALLRELGHLHRGSKQHSASYI
jgi:hypothetical protein